MVRYKDQVKEPNPVQPPTDPAMTSTAKEEPTSKLYYVVSWVIFIAAVFINVGVWAIDYFGTKIQHSYYYESNYAVSSTMDGNTYTDATNIYSESTGTPKAVAMSLIFSWILWKGALLIYALHLIINCESKALKIGTYIALLALILTIDILLTSFAKKYWRDYAFYGVTVLLIMIVSLVNNKEKLRALANTLIPLLLYAGFYFMYAWILPRLYRAYKDDMTEYGYLFLMFYTYPLWDLGFYSLTLFLGTKVDEEFKPFFSSLHFLLLGYGIGFTLLVGYTEVEFYYLLAYFIFRNIFVNYVMRRWESVVANPPCLPGWIICYYFSYAFSYLPVIGVGSVVISKSFLSYIWARTTTLLYGIPNPDYYNTLDAPTAGIATNTSMRGYIVWLAALILWLGTTFTQKYSCRKPSLYDLFYYLFGIQLFYVGISSALSVGNLINSNF